MCCKGNYKGGCAMRWVVKILLIAGGLNWGLVGAGMLMGSDWNVLEMLLGSWPVVLSVVYLLVGVAALVKIFGCCCSKCKEACMSDSKPAGAGM